MRRRIGRYGWAAASAASEPWTTTSTSPGTTANASARRSRVPSSSSSTPATSSSSTSSWRAAKCGDSVSTQGTPPHVRSGGRPSLPADCGAAATRSRIDTDVRPRGEREHAAMDSPDRLSALRDDEHRQLYMIRRRERGMAREARRLERELATLGYDEDRAERFLEEEWRREHFGREPDRPPRWWRFGPRGRGRRAWGGRARPAAPAAAAASRS